MGWNTTVPKNDGHYIIAIRTHYKDGEEDWVSEETHEGWLNRGYWTWNDGYGETVMHGNSDNMTTVYAWMEFPELPECKRVPLGKEG